MFCGQILRVVKSYSGVIHLVLNVHGVGKLE